MNKSKVLVVEDDPGINYLIKAVLDANDYQIYSECKGFDVLQDILMYNPEVVILDFGVFGLDGIDIIKKIRSSYEMPIIFVTAESDTMDKAEAIEAGADDYLTKPFIVHEFLARLKAALRRNKYRDKDVRECINIYENGYLKIDFETGCVYVENDKISLTQTEYRLLSLLAKNTDKVLTYNFILKEIWKNDELLQPSLLKAVMSKLKKKIEKDLSNPEYIQTCIGVGYRMVGI